MIGTLFLLPIFFFVTQQNYFMDANPNIGKKGKKKKKKKKTKKNPFLPCKNFLGFCN